MSRKWQILIVGVLGIISLNHWIADMGSEVNARWQAMSREERQAELRRISEEQAHRNLRENSDGKHCISSWSGEHRELAHYVKSDLREPDSYEHVQTVIMPVDEDGEHTLVMRYRARNGFGGMGAGNVIAQVQNSDCSFEITDMRSR